jgi:trimeric autotransporter adhesin
MRSYFPWTLLFLLAAFCGAFAHAQGVAFNTITSGTNTSAAMVVGTGSSLSAGGTGSIAATSLSSLTGLPAIGANTVLANMTSGSAAPTATSALLISSGVSGGVLCFTGTNSLASSAALTSSGLVVGGGASACPYTLTGSGVPVVTSGTVILDAYVPAANGGCQNNTQPNASVTNTACGAGAAANVTGTNVTAMGEYALANSSTAVGNTAVGYAAADYVSTGIGNTGIGYEALHGIGTALTTGNYNTALGSSALSNTQGAGAQNVGIGNSAGASNTTGAYNVFIGPAVGNSGAGTSVNTVSIGTSLNCALSSSSATQEIDLCTGSTNVLRITGGGTPSTSLAQFAGQVSTHGYPIASLPSCSSTSTGARAYVTNGVSTAAFMAAVGSSTGSSVVPVFCNGSVWVYG